MAKGIMQTMQMSLTYGLAHTDEIAPEVLIQVIQGFRSGIFPWMAVIWGPFSSVIFAP